MKRTNANRIAYYLILFFVIVLFVVIGIVTATTDYSQHYQESKIDFNEGWTTEDGNTFSLNETWTMWDDGAETFTVTKTLPVIFKSETACLNFRSKNSDFVVLVDDDVIYEYEQKVPKIVGKSCGIVFHHIDLYDSYKGKNIKIIVKASYHDDSCFINSASIEPALIYMLKYMQKHVMEFVIGIATFIIGVALLLLSAVMKRAKYETNATLSLGVLALILGFWTTIETVFAQMIFGKTALMHYLDFIMLMLLPVAAITFVNSYVLVKREFLVHIIAGLVFIELVGSTITTLTGIADYHEMLKVIHGVILLSVVFIVIMIVQNHFELIRRKLKTVDQYGIYLGVVVLVGTAMVELLKYNSKTVQTSDSAHIVRWGAFFFILIVSFATMATVLREMRLAKETETIQKMAYTDALTGMMNRTAFLRDEEHYEKEVQSGRLKEMMVVVIDLNNLKKINDTLGHHWGDEAIRKAAEIIEHAVKDKGTAYRIGGDEFAAFLSYPGKAIEKVWEECEKQLCYLEQVYNANPDKKFELAMAYGTVIYDEQSCVSVEKMEQIADRHMYEMKRDMKATKG
ncbi:MAG: GGDEF domain-containing protein [Eubacterium sp.]|nr:GGDEF domain-containing protein [Eubacterium sp.]